MKNIKETIVESLYTCKCYLMCGIPGSGKTTWCQKNIPNVTVVSRDITRAELGYTKNADEKAKLTSEQENNVTYHNDKLIDELISKKQDFAIDDTNTNKRFRKSLIDKLHKANVYIIGVDFDIPLDVCIERRKDQISADIMRKLYDKQVKLDKNEVDKYIKVTYNG